MLRLDPDPYFFLKAYSFQCLLLLGRPSGYLEHRLTRSLSAKPADLLRDAKRPAGDSRRTIGASRLLIARCWRKKRYTHSKTNLHRTNNRDAVSQPVITICVSRGEKQRVTDHIEGLVTVYCETETKPSGRWRRQCGKTESLTNPFGIDLIKRQALVVVASIIGCSEKSGCLMLMTGRLSSHREAPFCGLLFPHRTRGSIASNTNYQQPRK